MSLTTLRNKLKTECINKRKEVINKLNTEEGLNNYLKFEKKIYKINPKEKLTKYLFNKIDKDTENKLKHLEIVENTKDYSDDKEIIITLEWQKGSMGAYQVKAFDNYGNDTERTGGFGYDKESTVTAQILNKHPEILKLLYLKKEDYLNSNIPLDNKPTDQNGVNRVVLGYGSGYNILARFEGGVGVSCHQKILENVGLKMEHISNGKKSDVYRIYKPSKKVV